jgi:transposase
VADHYSEARLAQVRAHGKLGSADMFETLDAKLTGLPDHRIVGLEAWTEQIISADESLAATVVILPSVPGIGRLRAPC